jgi:hypothetical protein
MGMKMNVSPGPRTPSNFPRRNTTPRSYWRSTRSEPMRYRSAAVPRMYGQYMGVSIRFEDHGWKSAGTVRLKWKFAQSAWLTVSLSNSCWSASFPARLAVTMV